MARWLLAFAAAGLLYGATAARTIQWQDSGYHVLRVVGRQPINPMGLALSHPLHHWLGRAWAALLPLEPAHSLSLLSGFAAAVTVANVFGIVRQLTRRAPPAALAAAGLAVAHTFWKLGTIPESYTLATALLTCEVWAIVCWARTRRSSWLMAAFLANGLGLANHNLALLMLPVTGIVLLAAMWHREVGWRTLAACGLAWCFGAAPFIGLVVAQAVETGRPAEAVRSALFGTYQSNVIGVGISPRLPAISLAFTLLSFPNLTLPAAVLGLARGVGTGMPPLVRRVLLAALLIQLAFVLRYNVVDQYMFLLPSYAILAVLAGVGYSRVHVAARARGALAGAAVVLVLLTPLLYLAAPGLARRSDALGGHARNKPYRDDYAYLFTPWGVADRSADRMAREAISLAGRNGTVVVEDEMASYAIRYVRLTDGRPDVEITTAIDAQLLRRAGQDGLPLVYVPSTRTALPPEPASRWTRVGDLFVLSGIATSHAPDEAGGIPPAPGR